MSEAPGAPYGSVPSKRSFDNIPLQIDWHDYLVRLWRQGWYVEEGTVIRPRRKAHTGFEYYCTRTGVTEDAPPRWPRVLAGVEDDGSAQWRAQPVSSSSLRTQVSSSTWVPDSGITLSGAVASDLIQTVFADGGQSGLIYTVRNRLVLANGEEKEGVIILPVQDGPPDS